MQQDDVATQLVAPLLGLIGVILTALVSFISTWRWGAVPRRMSELGALIKDLPQERSRPLQQLLTDEIADYVAQENQRREDVDSERLVLVIRLTWVIRASLVAWLIAGLTRLVLLPWLGVRPGDAADELAGVAAGAFFGTALVAAILRVLRRRWRRQKLAAGSPPSRPGRAQS